MLPLTTLGDLIADLCLDVESFPILPSGHQTLSGLALGPGGAGNALVAAARLGLPAVALGCVGDDWIGARVLSHLNAEGVEAGRVMRQTGADTRTAVRLRAGTGEQVFMGRPGGLGPATLPETWAHAIADSGVLLVDGWSFFHSNPALVLQGVEAASQASVPLLFDPGPRVGAIDPEWLRTVTRAATVILATEPEHQALTRQLDLRDLRALKSLRALILKLGPGGCVISTAAERIVCPGYPVEAPQALPWPRRRPRPPLAAQAREQARAWCRATPAPSPKDAACRTGPRRETARGGGIRGRGRPSQRARGARAGGADQRGQERDAGAVGPSVCLSRRLWMPPRRG